MKINKWSVSLVRSVDWNLKGHYVSATDKMAHYPAPPLEVVAAAGIRRFPYDLAKQIGTYLEQGRPATTSNETLTTCSS